MLTSIANPIELHLTVARNDPQRVAGADDKLRPMIVVSQSRYQD
jgi:hypothetical protein